MGKRTDLPNDCHLALRDLKHALGEPLPGLPALLRMATTPRPGGARPPARHRPRQGGVLLLVYPIGDRLHVALTRRTEQVANHKGQISLPGGAREPADRTLLATALREASEELGVHSDELQILGPLTPFYIPPSDFCIQPFVAYTPRRPSFRLEPNEVAELLEMPLALLLDPATRQQGTWELRNRPVVVPFYRLGKHRIWGATAMILSEFEVLLTEARDAHGGPV